MGNRVCVITLALLSGLALTASGQGEPSAGAMQNETVLESMKRSAMETNIEDFLRNINENHWMCPGFYSRWSVQRISSVTERDALIRQREVGYALALRCEEWAREAGNIGDVTEAENLVGMLLELADWISQTRGYGNLLLAARCHDIACVGIARLLVDLQFSEERIESLIGCLDAEWYSPRIRAGVLNEEARGLLFDVGSISDEAELEKSFEETWCYGSFLHDSEKDPKLREAIVASGDRKEVPPVVRMTGAKALIRAVQRPILTERADFFSKDEYWKFGKPPTLLNSWDWKRHELLVEGFKPRNIESVKGLYLFRLRVKYFPKSRDEFRQAWDSNKRSGEERTVYASAWRAYQETLSGDFADEDTRMSRLHTLRQR